MKTHQKILFGGLGALTPVVMNLLVVDLNVLFLNLTLVAGLAYLTRVAILFALGGLVAFLHKDEKSPLKLIQLGIAAPALITGFLNGGQITVPKAPAHSDAKVISSLEFIPSAYAQINQEQRTKTFSLPKESVIEQFQRGFTGSVPKRVWFVIVGSYSSRENAEKAAKKIEAEFGSKGFKPEVYAPFSGNPNWKVVIGSNLTAEEAEPLRQRAVTAGLPKDIYVWTFAK